MHSLKSQDLASASAVSSDERLASLEAMYERLKADVAGVANKASEKAEAVADSAQDLYTSAESYIKSNPIPVAIGIAASAALITLLLSNRNPASRTPERRLRKELSRVRDDVSDTVRSELRRMNLDDGLSAITKALPETEIRRVVGPIVQQLVDGFNRAKDTITKSA